MKNLDIHSYKKLTQSEKQAFQCMEVLDSRICFKSLNEVAEHCMVSTATINRTLKKIGYINLKDYKQQFEVMDNQAPLTDFDSHLIDLLQNFPDTKLKEVVECIKSYHEVYVVGFGMTSSIALEFALNLIKLGIKTVCINDSEQYKIVSNSNFSTEKLFILISYKGENVIMISETQKINNNNKVILFTSTTSNPLSYHCHKVLTTNSLHYDYQFQSRITLNIITSKLIRLLKEG